MNTLKSKNGLSKLSGFKAEERETSILFDHYSGEVHIETTKPAVGRRLKKILDNDESVTENTSIDSFGIIVSIDHVRKPELILSPDLRRVLL